MQSASIKAFGLNEWAIRLPNALLALLCTLVTYTATRVLYGRRAAWLASIILATSVLYFGLAHLVTLDMTVTTFLTTSLLAFLIGTQQPPGARRRYLMWVFYAFAALTLLTKGLIGILFPGMIICAWSIMRHTERTSNSATPKSVLWLAKQKITQKIRLPTPLYLCSGILLFLLIAAPWHLLAQHANPEFFHFYFIEQQFQRYFTLSAGRYQPIWFFIPIVLLGFFPWTIFLPQTIAYHVRLLHKKYSSQHAQSALFLLLWTGLIFLFFSLSHSKLIPYILPIFPPLAILSGCYLDSVWEASRVRGITVGIQIFPIISMIIAVTLIIFSHSQTLNDPQVGYYYLVILASSLIVFSLITLIVYYYAGLKNAFISLCYMMLIVLWTVVAAAPNLDTRSIKPLAIILKKISTPHDEVAAFGIYYQDLPFYLQRHITVVEWKNELTFGLLHQQAARAWMIDQNTFWRRWDGPQQLYMIVPLPWYTTRLERLPHSFYTIAKTQDNILLSNHIK